MTNLFIEKLRKKRKMKKKRSKPKRRLKFKMPSGFKLISAIAFLIAGILYTGNLFAQNSILKMEMK